MHTKIQKIINAILFVSLILVCGAFLFPDYSTTIYTPNGSVVPDTYVNTPDLTASEIAAINADIDNAYPNAQRLSDATRTYNCHAYA
jgi:hypothetical protein